MKTNSSYIVIALWVVKYSSYTFRVQKHSPSSYANKNKVWWAGRQLPSNFIRKYRIKEQLMLQIRGGLAIGRIPGGLAANLARCPTFIYFLLFIIIIFLILLLLPAECTKVIISKFAIQ